jgi:hypothetical protein
MMFASWDLAGTRLSAESLMKQAVDLVLKPLSLNAKTYLNTPAIPFSVDMGLDEAGAPSAKHRHLLLLCPPSEQHNHNWPSCQTPRLTPPAARLGPHEETAPPHLSRRKPV